MAPGPQQGVPWLPGSTAVGLMHRLRSRRMLQGVVDVSAVLHWRSWKSMLFGGLTAPFYILQKLEGSGLACITGARQ